MKQPLKGDTIAISGDFGQPRSDENLKRWIESNGGRYAPKVEDGVTHLICSKEHWRSQAQAVQKARRMKKVKIVTYDWLEDSLQHKTHRREGEYLLTKVEKLDKKLKAERKAKEKKELKKDGKGKKQNPLTTAALAYLGQHAKDLKDGSIGQSGGKPTIEDYSTYMKDNTDDPLAAAVPSPAKASEADSETSSERSPEDGPTETPRETSVASPESASGKSSGKPSSKGSTKGLAQASIHISIQEAVNEANQDTGYKVSALDALRAHKAAKKKALKRESEMKSAFVMPPAFRKPETSPIQAFKKPPTDDILPSELDSYHVYRDGTGFSYSVTLVRVDVTTNSNERFIIRLFESHTVPKTYATHQRYVKPKHMPASEILVPIGGEFDTAFKAFQTAFKEKTAEEWEYRWNEKVPGEKRDITIEGGGKPFSWVKPKAGEPRGLVKPVMKSGRV